MSTETLGEKLRQLRELNELPLRKVAALIDIDVAILSKMERGERKFSKELIIRLADIYKVKPDELIVDFLSDKVIYELQDEELGIQALKIAEKELEYLILKRTQNG